MQETGILQELTCLMKSLIFYLAMLESQDPDSGDSPEQG